MAQSETAQNIKSKVGESYNYFKGKLFGEDLTKKEEDSNNHNTNIDNNKFDDNSNVDRTIDNQFTNKADLPDNKSDKK